jgi:IclR family acetate operon transcriptional repressor
MAGVERPPRRPAGGVQSLERAFDLLEAMADEGGLVGLSRLAAVSGLPLPTIHRLVRTLVALGYVGRLLGVWARPHLARLVDRVGESANLAVLDGSELVYVAQAPGRHAMRMFTEVGRRVSPHCTAVGKAVLAGMPDARVVDLLGRIDLVAHTPHTITDPDAYLRELARVRDRGYAVDEGELELGVRCVSVALDGGPGECALSVSGPTTRMTDELLARAVPHLRAAAEALVSELEHAGS